MKVAFVSDLHLEFGSNPPLVTDADWLVVAGDVISGRPHCHDLFYEKMLYASECYKEVFFLLGNHEYYHNRDVVDMAVWASGTLPPKVKLLHNTFFDIEGVRILGGTLWTDFYKANPFAMLDARKYMNDYNPDLTSLTPGRTYRMHKDTVEFLDANATEGCVVCTHHLPHYESVPPRFKGMQLNAAYASDLSWLMEKHKPALWVHGHTHDPVDYKVGQTRVVCNPHGYPNEVSSHRFRVRTVTL